MKYRNLLLFGALLWCPLWLLNPVWAQSETAIELGLEAEAYDNVFNTVNDKKSDTSLSFLFDLNTALKGTHYDLDVDYSGIVSTFLEDSFDDRHSLTGAAYLDIHSKRRHIGWLHINQQQDTLLNILGTETPDNFSQRSINRSGPYFNFRFGARSSLKLSATKTLIDVENSSADTEMEDARATWTLVTSRFSSWYLTASDAEIIPESFLVETYKQKTYLIGWDFRFRTGTFRASVGRSELDGVQSNNGETVDTPTYTANLDLTMGPGDLSIEWSRRLRNSAEGAFFGEAERGLGSDRFSVEEYRASRYRYSIPLVSDRTVLAFNVISIESDDSLLFANEQRRVYGASIEHALSPTSSVELRFASARNVLDSAGAVGESRGKRVELRYDYNLANKVEVECGFSHRIRQVELVDDVKANRLFCSLGYQLR